MWLHGKQSCLDIYSPIIKIHLKRRSTLTNPSPILRASHDDGRVHELVHGPSRQRDKAPVHGPFPRGVQVQVREPSQHDGPVRGSSLRDDGGPCVRGREHE